jgi:hypothetical protein
MHAADELDVQLERMFRLAARRAPSMTELDTLRAFFEVQHAEFLASDEAVDAYLDIGVLAPDPTLDAAWLAALGSTANVIFNLPDSYTLR